MEKTQKKNNFLRFLWIFNAIFFHDILPNILELIQWPFSAVWQKDFEITRRKGKEDIQLNHFGQNQFTWISFKGFGEWGKMSSKTVTVRK